MEFHLAVQGCEHVNRAPCGWTSGGRAVWSGNRQCPSLPLHAGGPGPLAAFSLCKIQLRLNLSRLMLIDIGDTAIGMHVKHVQVPIRPLLREIGHAHVTALASQSKINWGACALSTRFYQKVVRMKKHKQQLEKIPPNIQFVSQLLG